jgi:C-methyltransferase
VLDATPGAHGTLFELPQAAILSAIRRAAVPGATVLVIETVLPDDELDPAAQTLDVLMLAVTGGRERTPGQLSKLLSHAGFTGGTINETASRLRIVEARAA